MNNLIQFLHKNFHYLLFIILQIIAIVLIYHSMNYPRFKISTMSKTITGPFYEARFSIKKHFNFEAENLNLVEQNMILLREQSRNFIFSDDSLVQIIDNHATSNRTRLYDYFYANVIHNTIHKKNNYLIIDKGAKDGVEIDMAVISPDGIVGVVNDVSEHFASIISLLHSDSRISAKVYPVNQLGNIIWEDGDPESALLLDIPQHILINVGDSVFTSGYSYVFPKDILIGTISEKKENSKSSFLTLKVKLSTQFNRLNTIFLVKNIYKTELDSLKSNFKNE